MICLGGNMPQLLLRFSAAVLTFFLGTAAVWVAHFIMNDSWRPATKKVQQTALLPEMEIPWRREACEEVSEQIKVLTQIILRRSQSLSPETKKELNKVLQELKAEAVRQPQPCPKRPHYLNPVNPPISRGEIPGDWK
jgi:hypothetical protein